MLHFLKTLLANILLAGTPFSHINPVIYELTNVSSICSSSSFCCGQVVVLIGSSASAVDVSRDIAKVAKEVHISSRSAPDGPTAKHPGYYNMWLHSMIRSTHEDGTVVFWDGSSVVAEIILHCTGYKYNFPFLKTNDIVTVDDNRVGPLYKHVRIAKVS